MKDRRLKEFTKVRVKDAEQGLVTAVFATLNVIDSDGDVTVPGAFTEGEAVRISAYGHKSWEGKLPVGRGTIKEIGDEAIFEGKFFLNTEAGREHFELVKEMSVDPGLQEWSYGFDVLDGAPGQHDGQDVFFIKKLKVHEVSPVLLGAGVNTRTLALKGDQLKFADHLASVVAEVELVNTRASEVVALRAEKGKGLSGEHKALLDQLEASVTSLREVLASATGSKSDESPSEVLASDETKSDGTFPGLDLEAMFMTLNKGG